MSLQNLRLLFCFKKARHRTQFRRICFTVSHLFPEISRVIFYRLHASLQNAFFHLRSQFAVECCESLSCNREVKTITVYK
jgi:hypothetical protein